MRAKRYYETHKRLQDKPGLSAKNREELEKLGRRVTSMQLGGAREALVANAIGAALLGAAFLFLLLAGLERRSEKALPEPGVSRPNGAVSCVGTAVGLRSTERARRL